MKKEDLAKLLDGIEYPARIEPKIHEDAIKNRLVIVHGASDDLMEFIGAIDDEVGAWEGTTVKVDRYGILPSWEQSRDSELEAESYFNRKKYVKEIKAIWDKDGYSWTYETEIPHATFEVIEDGEKYCRGIVFSLDDL